MVQIEKNSKSNKEEITSKQLIAFVLASGITLAVAVAIFSNDKKYDSATSNSVVTETDTSVTCIVEDVGTVQNIDTKPDSHTLIDSDGKASIVYGGSSQEISMSYYIYLKDSNYDVFQFSVNNDVYTAMSRKKGDTITIYSKETLFGNVYYWQGNKLENPLKITE